MSPVKQARTHQLHQVSGNMRFVVLLLALVFIVPGIVFAQTLSSSHYLIQNSSFSGDINASSTSYRMNGTLSASLSSNSQLSANNSSGSGSQGNTTNSSGESGGGTTQIPQINAHGNTQQNVNGNAAAGANATAQNLDTAQSQNSNPSTSSSLITHVKDILQNSEIAAAASLAHGTATTSSLYGSLFFKKLSALTLLAFAVLAGLMVIGIVILVLRRR